MTRKLAVALLLLTLSVQAKDAKFYQKGVLAEMDSVECGSDEKTGKGFTGVVLGTDSGHRKTRQLLCPEYVLRTDKVLYRIRPKEEKHPVLLPVGETAEFRFKKDLMLLRVVELDGKERKYIVVSMRPLEDLATNRNASQRPAPRE